MQLSYGSTCEESYHVYPINRALQDLIGIRRKLYSDLQADLITILGLSPV